MDNLLNEIIKGDEAAQERLLQAEEYRRAQLADLQNKKEQIEKEEIQKAIDEAVKRSEKNKSAGDKKLGELRQSQKNAEEKMDALYTRNSSKWVKEIVDGVING